MTRTPLNSRPPRRTRGRTHASRSSSRRPYLQPPAMDLLTSPTSFYLLKRRRLRRAALRLSSCATSSRQVHSVAQQVRDSIDKENRCWRCSPIRLGGLAYPPRQRLQVHRGGGRIADVLALLICWSLRRCRCACVRGRRGPGSAPRMESRSIDVFYDASTSPTAVGLTITGECAPRARSSSRARLQRTSICRKEARQ